MRKNAQSLFFTLYEGRLRVRAGLFFLREEIRGNFRMARAENCEPRPWDAFPAMTFERCAIPDDPDAVGCHALVHSGDDLFRSTLAFSPIISPINCAWGEKAPAGYLGSDKAGWRAYDSCALIEDDARLPDLQIDQGEPDGLLLEQLKTHLLEKVCAAAGQKATIRMQPGYDHSYYFISTFMAAGMPNAQAHNSGNGTSKSSKVSRR